MSNIITVQGRSASTIAAEIRSLDAQGKFICLTYIFEIGRRLVEAKDLVNHGEWGQYLETEVSYSQDTANKYMRIYREYNVAGAMPNSDTFRNLEFSKAYKLLALPADQRETFAQENDIANKSTREIDRLIKERDAALAAQKKAEEETASALAEKRDLEQELLDAQNKAATAKSSEDAWQAEIDKLNAALNKATAAEEKAVQKLKKLKENPTLLPSVLEKITAEAHEKAAAEARVDIQKQLDDAVKAAEAAAREKEEAEKVAQAAQEQLAAVQKTAKLANPDVAAINVLSNQLADTFNKLHGHLKKLEAADPELARKIKGVVSKFGADVQQRMK